MTLMCNLFNDKYGYMKYSFRRYVDKNRLNEERKEKN